MSRRPTYPIDSVDSALRLLQILHRDGELRVTSAARELGVAPSTAHRLLAMLVYRGFAVHQPDHSYRLGSPAGGDVMQAESERLVELCRPHMVRLCAATAESVNLMRRAGPSVVFLEAVESAQVLRVGSRVGTRMPARVTSGGLALLSHLSRDEIVRLYPDLAKDSDSLSSLLSQLSTTRRLGYGLNYQASEVGVAAIGVAIRDAAGSPLCAVTVAAPVARYRKGQVTQLLPALRECREQLEVEIASRSVYAGANTGVTSA